VEVFSMKPETRAYTSRIVVSHQVAVSIFEWRAGSTATEIPVTVKLLHFSCKHTAYKRLQQT